MVRLLLSRRAFVLRRLSAALIGFAAGLAITLSLVGFARPVYAQVLSPMDSYVAAQSDVFLLKVSITNPYESPQISEISLLDHTMNPIEPVSSTIAPLIRLGSGEVRNLSMLVEFEPGRRTRVVYVCHAIAPRDPNNFSLGSAYKGEVCGKVSAFKLS